ncbi:MAG TPA: DUF4260 domain-containing protein [Candidatus Saccharibacteria bacterium]|nr:DUF4260 domain-containing protein [Candidatus Saccharibacteria bacterium]
MTKKDWYSVGFLRLEGLVFVAFGLYLFASLEVSWVWFLLLIMLPDISMFGYLFNKKIGAIIYNLGHSLILPFCLLFINALLLDKYNNLHVMVPTPEYYYTLVDALFVSVAVWIAHIGMDRALGFGLKTSEGFHHTHLGIIGKKTNSEK